MWTLGALTPLEWARNAIFATREADGLMMVIEGSPSMTELSHNLNKAHRDLGMSYVGQCLLPAYILTSPCLF